MYTFEFIRPADSAAAVATVAQAKTAPQGADARFVAGGTTLLDLMKLNVELRAGDRHQPTAARQDRTDARRRAEDRCYRTKFRFAHHPTVQRDYAVLSQAILAGASAQLRNMATTAGNLRSARAACISATPPCRATNESPEPAAPRSPGPIGCLLF